MQNIDVMPGTGTHMREGQRISLPGYSTYHAIHPSGNSRGLSGARTKWYLRYLQQGKSPGEAFSLAKTPQPLEQRPNSASKRANSTLTPPTETPKRQKVEKSRPPTGPFDGPSTSRTATATEVRKQSYAAVTGAIKVSVVPEGYPKIDLSSENLSQLEDPLLEEIGEDPEDGSLLSLGIDDNSCAKIFTSDHKLSFRFGDISVCGLKKAKAIKAGTRRVETPRNLPVSAEKEKPDKLSESSEDLADDEDLDATVIEMGDHTPISSQELGMELDLLSEEEAVPADGDLGISRSVTPTMETII
ncbi:GM15029 [Drosophila sechellia]|uniref:GM15029 n=1 Tax=Drosophila sechellia TaxID=7238 RepID=B4IMZ3_DROSE|nr:GM15029 [Drosophila sechellia]